MKYKFYNQDCIKGAKKYLEDESIDLIITDPPFAINGDELHKHYNRNEDHVIDGYVEVKKEEYADFSLAWIQGAERILRPGGALAVVSGYSNLGDLLNALRQTSLKERNHLIWKYNFGVYTRSKFVSSHYHILYYLKPGGVRTFNTFSRFGSRERDDNDGSLLYQDLEDVWTINRVYKPGEPKNKNSLPAELLLKLVQYLSNPGDIICDFFLGSFSTAKVAKGMGRSAVGFEINSTGFKYHLKQLEKVEINGLQSNVRTGIDDTPLRAGEPWDEEEVDDLWKRYRELKDSGHTKKKSVEILMNEFQRGNWSIIKRINSFTAINGTS